MASFGLPISRRSLAQFSPQPVASNTSCGFSYIIIRVWTPFDRRFSGREPCRINKQVWEFGFENVFYSILSIWNIVKRIWPFGKKTNQLANM